MLLNRNNRSSIFNFMPQKAFTIHGIQMIEDTFNITGLGHIWLLDRNLNNIECIKDRLQLRLNDIFGIGMVGSNMQLPCLNQLHYRAYQ